MLDESVYSDENTPSSFSGDSGIEIERRAVFRNRKPALPVGSRSSVSVHSGTESLKSVSPAPRDIFSQTRVRLADSFNCVLMLMPY
jgi:hypothetical protein